MKSQSIVSLLSLVATATAHGGVCSYDIDGTHYKGVQFRMTPDWETDPSPESLKTPSIQRRWHPDPILDVTDQNMTCSFDGASTISPFHAPIKAGNTITAHWNEYTQGFIPNTWVHGDGPMFAYLARCPGESCSGFDGKGAVWFKIAQVSLMDSAVDMRGPSWQGVYIGSGLGGVPPGWNVTIPKNLKAGKYLIRHEVMMQASNPAQFYPNCAQLDVSGEGNAIPDAAELVSFPGAYSADDVAIKSVDWWMNTGGSPVKEEWKTTVYPYPGPPVWKGGE